jgi:hypothetical protein
MKKLSILFLAVAFLGLNQAFAQQPADDTQENAPVAAVEMVAADSHSETEVAIADLPEAVRTTLGSDDYKGWTASKAMHIKKEDGTEYYKVVMTRGAEETKLKLTADGKVLPKPEQKG